MFDHNPDIVLVADIVLAVADIVLVVDIVLTVADIVLVGDIALANTGIALANTGIALAALGNKADSSVLLPYSLKYNLYNNRIA